MADEPGSPAAEEIDLRVTGPTERASRRRALWGALAVVAIAAGTVVVTAGGGGDGLPLLPAGAGGAGRAEGAMAADSSMLAWVHYVAGDELPALGGDAAAYRLSGAVGEGSVRELAAALGLDGSVERTGDPGWRVTADDGAVLEVVDDGGAAWWYSTGSPDQVTGGGSAGATPEGSGGCVSGPECELGTTAPATTVVCLPRPADGGASPECEIASCPAAADCVEPVPADKACPPDALCTEPTPDGDCVADVDCTVPEPAPVPIEPPPAADLPSEEEARGIALDLLAATGADVEDARVTMEGPYDAWYISVEHAIDGVPVAGWYSMVAVGPDGEVLHANGMLATWERLGDYPLIDTRTAIDRLNEQQTAAFEGAGWAPYPGAPEAASAAGTATADAGDASASAPVTSPPPPCDPELSPEDMDRCLAAGGYAIPTTSVPDPCPDDTKAADQDPASPCSDPPCIPGSVPVAETTVPGQAPDTTLAPTPGCEPVTLPAPVDEPEPLEVVLTTADPVLVLTVGSEGAYLVPGYRFGNADGMQVEVSAVADDHLAPTTTVPPTEAPDPPVTDPGPTDCEVLVEDDGSGSTHTMHPCTTTTTIAGSEPRPLEPGELPAEGVPYQVDVDLTCAGGSFLLADRVFVLEQGDTSGWSSPQEGGTFVLDGPDHGTFTGDAGGSKTATFRTLGPAEDVFCAPQPRG